MPLSRLWVSFQCPRRVGGDCVYRTGQDPVGSGYKQSNRSPLAVEEPAVRFDKQKISHLLRQKTGNFMTRLATIVFSIRPVLHEVACECFMCNFQILNWFYQMSTPDCQWILGNWVICFPRIVGCACSVQDSKRTKQFLRYLWHFYWSRPCTPRVEMGSYNQLINRS